MANLPPSTRLQSNALRALRNPTANVTAEALDAVQNSLDRTMKDLAAMQSTTGAQPASGLCTVVLAAARPAISLGDGSPPIPAPVSGLTFLLEVVQDVTGGWPFGFSADFVPPDELNLALMANTMSVFAFYASGGKWRIQPNGYMTGVAL